MHPYSTIEYIYIYIYIYVFNEGKGQIDFVLCKLKNKSNQINLKLMINYKFHKIDNMFLLLLLLSHHHL
jgi:hypothetical protein